MKKKLITSVLLSTVALSQGATFKTVVNADDTDAKIAAQDNKINDLTAQQQSTQSQVDAIQSQVAALQSQKADLQAENDRLNEESKQLEQEISDLSAKIVSRSESLKKQARSAQTNGTATSYINTLLNSSSIVDAISRVSAMNEIVSANNKMLDQQKKDKEFLSEKQVANTEAINTVIANQQTLADNEQTLNTKQAELEAAKLSLAAEKAAAQDEKNTLLEQKAAAEKAAAEAAAREAAYKAEQEAKAKAAAESAKTNLVAQVQAAATTAATTVTEAPVTPAGNTTTEASKVETAQPQATPAVTDVTPAVQEVTAQAPSQTQVTPVATTAPATPAASTTSSANTYPIGECTWGAKTLAPWAGNYWGNGGQWAASAAAAGFRVGSTPAVGAIAVWNDGGYGHVAVVTAVESDSRIQVSEANYAGNRAIGNYRGWFNPTVGWGSLSYIYPN